MVDLNGNDIPDQLEKYVNTTIIQKMGEPKPDVKPGDNTNVVINEQAENEMLKRLINENYITAHFEVDKVTPTTVESIDFVLNYLRKNPESKVEIFGNADANGNKAYNDRLSGNRAKHVKNMLVKAGIATSRIEIKPNGVDSSVNKGSKSAKRLVRRVTFKVS